MRYAVIYRLYGTTSEVGHFIFAFVVDPAKYKGSHVHKCERAPQANKGE